MKNTCKAYLLSMTTAALFTIMGMHSQAMCGGTAPEESAVIQDERPDKSGTYLFVCDDNFEFVARTRGESFWLFLPTVTLEFLKDSAETYRSGDLVFRHHDQKGRLKEPGGKFRECRNDPQRAVWEHAKLNGADFRAIGNEPGWNLEIVAQEKIVLVTDYGAKRYEYALPNPVTDAVDRWARYTVVQPGPEMSLTIFGETCQDSMSGETFESRVEVVVNGETLRGCGRTLH